MRTSIALLAAALTASSALAGQEVWANTQCGFLTMDRIDPIISPGKASSHQHTLFGASNLNKDSTYASLRKSPGNTCGIVEDMSAYWFPSIWAYSKDSKYSPLAHTGSIPVYYKFNYDGTSRSQGVFKPFPENFQMVTGNNSARTCGRTSDEASRGLWYVCDGDRSKYYDHFPVNRKCTKLTIGINYPWCWNGQATSPDHASHVTYPTNWISKNEMKCPSTHPYSLPMPFIEHDFDASAIDLSQAMYPEQPFILANGDLSGCSLHADFQNGFDPAVIQKIIDVRKPGDDLFKMGLLHSTTGSQRAGSKPASIPDVIGSPGQWIAQLPGAIYASGSPLGVAPRGAPEKGKGPAASPASSVNASPTSIRPTATKRRHRHRKGKN